MTFYGHEAGDEVLVVVADILRSSLRASDVNGRLGGDEFCPAVTRHECARCRALYQTLAGGSGSGHGGAAMAGEILDRHGELCADACRFFIQSLPLPMR